MRIDIITIFPKMFTSPFSESIIKRAIDNNLVSIRVHNLRKWTQDNHKTVDDRPYGGGHGMVMMIEPLRQAIQDAKAANPKAKVIYMSPQGKVMDQDAVGEFAESDGLILVAGRYEGIDERLIEMEVDEEWSIGDYVLSGGELAAMVVVDSVTRLLPGVLGDEDSAQQDSFMGGLLDCPHYTRPEDYEGRKVPPVLLGGNHKEIAKWRRKQSLVRTFQNRPNLLEQVELNEEDRLLLEAGLNEQD